MTKFGVLKLNFCIFSHSHKVSLGWTSDASTSLEDLWWDFWLQMMYWLESFGSENEYSGCCWFSDETGTMSFSTRLCKVVAASQFLKSPHRAGWILSSKSRLWESVSPWVFLDSNTRWVQVAYSERRSLVTCEYMARNEAFPTTLHTTFCDFFGLFEQISTKLENTVFSDKMDHLRFLRLACSEIVTCLQYCINS